MGMPGPLQPQPGVPARLAGRPEHLRMPLTAGQDTEVQPVRKLPTSWAFFGSIFIQIAKSDWLRWRGSDEP